MAMRCKHRAKIAAGVLTAACLSSLTGVAAPEAAPFECPAVSTFVEFSRGSKLAWTGEQEDQACAMTTAFYFRGGQQSRQFFWGPTLMTGVQTQPALIRYNKRIQSKLWPLQVGKSFTERYEGPGANGESGIWIHTFSVDSFERVTSPAGTFDAFRVTRTEKGTGPYRETWTQWYAPSVRVVIKYDYSNSNQIRQAEEAIRITK